MQKRVFTILFICFAIVAGKELLPVAISASVSAAENKIGASGAPIPRFVSLAAKKAFMRTGPGRQYPIDWVYTRPGLPLEVIAEDGPWRRVQDHDGIRGWMHVSLLSGKRTAMIIGRTRKLYDDTDLAAAVTITADMGVTGEIVRCKTIWCKLDIDGSRGWLERRNLYGVYPDEVLD